LNEDPSTKQGGITGPGPNRRRLSCFAEAGDVQITFGQITDGRWEVRATSRRWRRPHAERHRDIEVACAALISWLIAADVWVPFT
jgi:hypothetical protein